MKLRLGITVMVLLAPPILAWAAGDRPAARDHWDGKNTHSEPSRVHDGKDDSKENFESKEVTAPNHAEQDKKETGSRRMREAGHLNERY